MSQLDMFGGGDSAPVPPGADPDRVRRKLAAMLAEARDPQALPQGRRRLIETVVPQMVRWLPDDEARRVRDAFEQALAA